MLLSWQLQLINVSYHGHPDKAKVELLICKRREFAIRHHIKFVNCIDDAGFLLNSLMLVMTDHMNARGAMKSSRVLDEGIIKVRW